MLWHDMTFGVEIECYKPVRSADLRNAMQARGLQTSIASRTHQTTSGWKIVNDASLMSPPSGTSGIEVVSPILQGEAGLEQVRKVSDAIKEVGGVINRTCGLHVHVGARNASPLQLRNLAKQFVKYEHHFDSVCPMSRRDNRYAKSNLTQASGVARGERSERIRAACARIDRATTTRDVAIAMNGGFNQTQHYTDFRYFKLNFQSLNAHGTVEFRQQAGSVEHHKICNWIKCVTQFTAHAFTLREVATDDEPTWEKFLRKVGRDVAAYLIDRRERMNRHVNAAASPARAPRRDTNGETEIPF